MGEEYIFRVYASRVTFPLSFAVHTWVACVKPKGSWFRYDVHSYKNKHTNNFIFKNNQPYDQGMSLFGFLNYWFSDIKFSAYSIYECRGIDAQNAIERIEKSIDLYPYKSKYVLYPGPNSNTFTKWLITKAELEKQVLLPYNAFGRNLFKNKKNVI